jgi:hypothetical protein
MMASTVGAAVTVLNAASCWIIERGFLKRDDKLLVMFCNPIVTARVGHPASTKFCNSTQSKPPCTGFPPFS